MNGTKTLGLYFHAPFCDGKCPYCDFYSIRADEAAMDAYTDAICDALTCWGRRTGRYTVDTVYFGGGTPALLGAARLSRILETSARNFKIFPDAEVTVEANPAAALRTELAPLRQAGFNRISLGLQSAHKDELCFLGRRHTAADAAAAVEEAYRAGFERCSLDLMLALEGQTVRKAEASVDFCASLGVEHVSAYLLKIEEGTPFARRALRLPGEELQRDIYLAVCERLKQSGYCQYEISNFAKPGSESRHNLKYWNDEEYLGLGPSAHSFLNGRRFYYPRDLHSFLDGGAPVQDGPGGDFEEYAMLRLRLTAGLREDECRARFGVGIPDRLRERAAAIAAAGVISCRPDGLSLTTEGFLVSNAVIARLLG